MEKIIDLFLKETNYCKMCGSQRCERNVEWVEGCQHFKEYVRNYNLDRMTSNYYCRND